MARIEQVKVHRGPFHTAGSPVAVEAYALLIDRKTGKYYAQVKFANVCMSKITSVVISVAAHTLEGLVELTHIYPAINLYPGACHGSQEAVPLGDAQVVDIDVAACLVELESEPTWEGSDDTAWRQLPTPRQLKELDAPGDYVRMYRSVFGKARYVPWATDELWQCSCGALNHIGCVTCNKCGYRQTDIMTAANADSIVAAERDWRTIRIKQLVHALAELAEKRGAKEELERKKAERAKQLAKEKAAKEREELAKAKKLIDEAQKLIAGGGEAQLNKAVKILDSVPKHAGTASEAAENTKINAMAKLQEKRQKKRNVAIAITAAFIAAITCGPLIFGAIGDQIALSNRLKPNASENPVVISYDDREYDNLCEKYIGMALEGEELRTNELELLLSDECENNGLYGGKGDDIFKTIFPSVYNEADEKWGNKKHAVTISYLHYSDDENGIKKLAIDDNRYSLQVTGELSVGGSAWVLPKEGHITYTIDLYLGVPSKNKVTVANAKIVNLVWE